MAAAAAASSVSFAAAAVLEALIEELAALKVCKARCMDHVAGYLY